MTDWLSLLLKLSQQDQPCILVTVADTQGSTPREVGAKMVVTQSALFGSIGGGNLEHSAIDKAHEMLESIPEAGDRVLKHRFVLGPGLSQCCGGVATLLFETVSPMQSPWQENLNRAREKGDRGIIATISETEDNGQKIFVTMSDCEGTFKDTFLHAKVVTEARKMLLDGQPACQQETKAETGKRVQILFEPFPDKQFNIVLFGAGHVGKALIQVLNNLACNITWIDGRKNQFPQSLPNNVSRIISRQPENEVEHMRGGSYYLVMTHSHALDEDIIQRILCRDDIAYCGLIGSASKRLKFEKRLHKKGVAKQSLESMICPIGIEGISGKQPAEIAISVAAQLLRIRSATIL